MSYIPIYFFLFGVKRFYGHDTLKYLIIRICPFGHLFILLFINCLMKRKKIIITHREKRYQEEYTYGNYRVHLIQPIGMSYRHDKIFDRIHNILTCRCSFDNFQIPIEQTHQLSTFIFFKKWYITINNMREKFFFDIIRYFSIRNIIDITIDWIQYY